MRHFIRGLAMLLLVGLVVAQSMYYHPRLPETVASHFNAAGRPDGWMTRGGMLAFGIGTVLVLAVLFPAIAYAMETIHLKSRARKGGDEERTAEANAAGAQLAKAMGAFMFRTGVLTILLLLVMFQLAIQANLHPDPVLRHAWPVLAGYLVAMAASAVPVIIHQRRFSRLSPAPPLPPDVWFPAKRFGYGWGPPVCWQGWLFTIGWMVGMLVGTLLILRTELPILLVPFEIVMVIVLIVVCVKKGEKPRWRWGE